MLDQAALKSHLEELSEKRQQSDDGPWKNEPDRYEFKYAGFDCLLQRNRVGGWCGYVGLPKTHALYGKNYNEPDVAVHGGLTYGSACGHIICHLNDDDESLWWFGFDCGHAWDYCPYSWLHLPEELREQFKKQPDEVYRNFDYAKAQCERLASQLARKAG